MSWKGKIAKYFKDLGIWVVAFAAIIVAYYLFMPSPGWVTVSDTGCKIWNDYSRLTETANWSGQCRDGKATGQGVLKITVFGKKPVHFEGNFVHGKLHGRGTKTWSSGTRYEGDFVDGQRTGKGILVWGPKTKWTDNRYEGDFIDGKSTGKGIYVWTSGNRYEGDVIDGKSAGKGILFWADGDRYEGGFIDGKRAGKGILFWADGDRYEGDFIDGKRAACLGQ